MTDLMIALLVGFLLSRLTSVTIDFRTPKHKRSRKFRTTKSLPDKVFDRPKRLNKKNGLLGPGLCGVPDLLYLTEPCTTLYRYARF